MRLRRAVLTSLLACWAACNADALAPRPAGLLWLSGSSGAWVGDTVPLVVFYKRDDNTPIGLPRPSVAWTSSNPAIMQVLSDTASVALDTGVVTLVGSTNDGPEFRVEVTLCVVPSVTGRLIWLTQDTIGAGAWQVKVKDYPQRVARLLPDFGYPRHGKAQPALTSDSRRAAIVAQRVEASGSDGVLWLVDTDGGGSTQMFEYAGAQERWPVWFPDDTLVAFLRGNVQGGLQIHTAHPDGSDIRVRTRLYQGNLPAFDLTPDFHFIVQARGDLLELTLDGDTVGALTSGEQVGAPFVSPDGSLIAFGHAYDEVAVMNRDGSGRRALGPRRETFDGFDPNWRKMPAMILPAAWTPDGQYVVVIWYIDPYLNKDGRHYNRMGDLYAIRVSDGLAVRLTRSAAGDGQADFR